LSVFEVNEFLQTWQVPPLSYPIVHKLVGLLVHTLICWPGALRYVPHDVLCVALCGTVFVFSIWKKDHHMFACRWLFRQRCPR
jgi:hypothetical protein